jgi:hypothetical protein
MTLKEKLKDRMYYNYNHLEVAEECEQIADEFSIKFAEWCAFYIYKSRNVFGDMLHAKSKYDDMYTSKELLEIFKKEKGL